MSGQRRLATVDGAAAAQRAAAAARADGAALTLLSAPGGAAQGGCAWFRQLAAQTAAAFPDVALDWALDCGDQAGDALAALADGCPAVIFTGPAPAAARLAEIAAARGAALWRERPDEACDLMSRIV